MKALLSCVFCLLAGCRSSPVPGTDNNLPDAAPPADAGATDAVSGPSVDRGGAASDADLPGSSAACLEQPGPRPGARATLTVHVELTYGGKPVVFGEPFPLSAGTLTLTNFRFYLSDVSASGRSGESTGVDIVGADGSPVPYNVHLVNPEDPDGMTFRLAVPPGDYAGLSFLLGIPDDCNRADASHRRYPLTADSQMTWPPPFGYLFLRYAGTISGAPPTAMTPTRIDLGGFPGALLAPRVEAPGALAFEDLSARTVRLRVALEELFRAAALPATLDQTGMIITSGPASGPAFEAGEHVRQNAPKVSMFSLIDGR